ncbi:MAG: GNAT family N-acetyltransferase [Chloroflexi bacterium]|nr:GNAT family N-acetyltransferase [Chloroflexota bacterium]
MNVKGADYVIRGYRKQDYQSYASLIIETEGLEPSGRCTSPQALAAEMDRPGHPPEKYTLVAGYQGGLAGLASVVHEPVAGRSIVQFLVHPAHRKPRLRASLLDSIIQLAEDTGMGAVQANARQADMAARRMLAQRKFRVVRRFLEMRLEMDNALLAGYADDYQLRSLDAGEEDKLAELQNRCFAGTWGYNPNTAEEIAYFMKVRCCRPEDVLLVYQSGSLVAYCWTGIDPNDNRRGYICMLGVEPGRRERGTGRAALESGLQYLRGRGASIVDLSVDSENAPACKLYNSAGFHVRDSTLWYQKQSG